MPLRRAVALLSVPPDGSSAHNPVTAWRHIAAAVGEQLTPASRIPVRVALTPQRQELSDLVLVGHAVRPSTLRRSANSHCPSRRTNRSMARATFLISQAPSPSD